MVTVYSTLEEFVIQLAEEDPHFVVFPHNLSEYESESIEDLPPPIKNPDNLPDDIGNWLMYFHKLNLEFPEEIPILPY